MLSIIHSCGPVFQKMSVGFLVAFVRKRDQVLRKGTERGYRAMDFTTTGEKLASVGQAPDFMLTVWDWVNEKVILHCKAFGQDVAKVTEASDTLSYHQGVSRVVL